jgi:arylsulfatase A-like enzyme
LFSPEQFINILPQLSLAYLLKTSPSKPHLLFFNPDQWRGDVLGHMGNPAAVTPNLDALAQEGVSFQNAYCQSPVCTPSRCSFMTGWYPHTRGHRTIHHLLHSEHGENHLLKSLKEAGYFIFWAGKNDLVAGDDDFTKHCDVLFQPTPADFERWGVTQRPDIHQDIETHRGEPGSDRFYSFFRGRLEKGAEPIYANTDWPWILGAIDFIKNYEGEKPLCVFLSLQYPHPPYCVEDPWYSMINRGLLPPRVPEPADLASLPLAVGGLIESLNLRNWTEERWTELRATYYAMCARVDHQFGMVCDALRERKFYDDTGIFFFSDHGDYTGDYNLVEKAQNLFQDCLVRIPFLVRPPRGVGCQPGVRTALVELVDFPATVSALTGIDLGHTQFGRSLLPLIAGETTEHRDAVFCEGGRLRGESQANEHHSWVDHAEPEKGLYWPRMQLQQSEDPLYHGKGAMIRTVRYKYVRRLYEQDELYDLESDPKETLNRISDPALAEVRHQLERRLLAWMMETADVVPRQPDRRGPAHYPKPKSDRAQESFPPSIPVATYLNGT